VYQINRFNFKHLKQSYKTPCWS